MRLGGFEMQVTSGREKSGEEDRLWTGAEAVARACSDDGSTATIWRGEGGCPVIGSARGTSCACRVRMVSMFRKGCTVGAGAVNRVH